MKLILDNGEEVEIQSVKEVRVKDGDIVVVRMAHPITQRVKEQLHDEVKNTLFPDNNVLFLHDSMDIEIIRKVA